MAGIYIHIPFCLQACHYCDFHFSTNPALAEPMVEAIVKELVLQREFLEEEVQTIYFGGGTPSMMDARLLGRVLKTVHDQYQVAAGAEITLEVNPEDVNQQHIDDWQAIGANRVSMGIQSMDENLLVFMNRAHTSEGARKALELIAPSFPNFNLDLIFGIPDARPTRLEDDLRQLLKFSPTHISAYALTIEPRTVFGHRLKKGMLQVMDDDLVADEFMQIHDALSTDGFEHYEVSNYAREGYISRHNSTYWKGGAYLGVGPSAHSYNGQTRQFNVANNTRYIKSLAKDEIPATEEKLGKKEQINDYLLTTLRTKWGTSFDYIREYWGYDVKMMHKGYLTNLVTEGLGSYQGEHFVLTSKGMLLADQLAMELFYA